MEAQNARAGLCGEQVPSLQGSRHFHPKTQASAALRLGLSTFAPLALMATGGIVLWCGAFGCRAMRCRGRSNDKGRRGRPFRARAIFDWKPRPALRCGLGSRLLRLWRWEAIKCRWITTRSAAVWALDFLRLWRCAGDQMQMDHSRPSLRRRERQRRGSRKPRPTEAQRAEARPGFPSRRGASPERAKLCAGVRCDCRRRHFPAPSAHAAIPRQRAASHGLEHETSGTLDRR